MCFGFVSIALTWFGTDSVMALLGGVMAIATAPAVVLVVLRDLKAEGQVTPPGGHDRAQQLRSGTGSLCALAGDRA
jgi:hypothetical protein